MDKVGDGLGIIQAHYIYCAFYFYYYYIVVWNNYTPHHNAHSGSPELVFLQLNSPIWGWWERDGVQVK